ncbi:MAG: ABC transporter ATP-binding protein [Thermodesulfobacteriota bacterium]
MAARGSDQSPALTLEGVSKSFGGVEAVVQVSLTVAQGESRALIGPNGAGKSTLFNLITGEVPRDQGRIILFGQDLTLAPVQRRIQMGLGRTYQTSNLFMNLTVRENLFLAVWKRGQASAGRWATLFRSWRRFSQECAEAEKVALDVGLAPRLDLPVNELSHGEHRQLELGLTLAHQPRILLLDEPMAGLSAPERTFMTSLIMGLRSRVTVLFIEHDLDIAFSLADMVSVLHQGQIIAAGSPLEVKANQQVQEIYTLRTKNNRLVHA